MWGQVIAAVAIVAAASIPAVIADRRAKKQAEQLSKQTEQLSTQVGTVHQDNRDDHANVWTAVTQVLLNQADMVSKIDVIADDVAVVKQAVVIVDHRADELDDRVTHLERRR